MRRVAQSFAPTTDDWFVVSLIEDRRWYIERVVAWALLPADEAKDDVLAAFTGQGHIAAEENQLHYQYVKGTDKCPTGRRWGEIYDDIVPNGREFREIKDPQLLAALN